MSKSKLILKGILKCGFSFIKYNYFCRNIIRKANCYLFPYRGTIIQIAPSAKIVLNGNMYINAGKYKGSKAEAYLILDQDSVFKVKDNIRLLYGATVHLNPKAELEAGSFTTNVGINFQIRKKLSIGEDCMFGRNCMIFDSAFHPTGISRNSIKTNTEEVVIGNHVWIGANAFLSYGTHIGDGSIIGSNTFINGKIEQGSTVSRNTDEARMFGNMWARSEEVESIGKAITYYPDLSDIESSQENVPHQFKDELAIILHEKFPNIDFTRNRLLQDHIVDSLSLLAIVKIIENHFQIKIPFTEISARNFDSLVSMAGLIEKVTTQGTGKINYKKNKVLQVKKEEKDEAFSIPHFSSILEAVIFYSSNQPDKLFLTNGVDEYTYSEAVRLMVNGAAFLNKIGINKGDTVVAEGYQSPEFLLLELSLHCLSAIFVPMEQNCADDKLRTIAERCEAKLIFTINPKNIETIHTLTYKTFLNAPENDLFKFDMPDEESVSEILFSTGTTGKEKGIVLTHKNAVAVAENIFYAVKMQNDNVELIPSPLNHSHGLRSCYANMIGGATIVTLDNIMDIQKFFEVIDRYNVNSMDLVPTALSVILQLSDDKLGEYSDQLRYIEFGSAAMFDSDRNKIMALLPKVPLYNFYGSTEAGRSTVYNFNRTSIKEKCIGRPTYNSKLIIVNDERREISSSKENTGLLACSGSMNMLEYYKDVAETESVMENGYIYSNDEAYFDEDGDIILLGRRGDVINIGGKKVSPEEIESIAKMFPGIADCGCIGVEDRIAGTVPKLFVQMKSGYDFDSKRIADYILNKAEAYKVPKYIEKIDKIPRTYNGKLSRKELKRLHTSEE